MFKKILLILFLSTILVSCWDSDEVVTTTWLTNYNSEKFSIDVPSSWEIIAEKDKILPKPNSWEISLAVRSKETNNWFANNLLVLSSELNKITLSKDFSILNNIGAEKDYLNYTKLDARGFTFNDGEESMLYIFEAKYNMDTPKLRFIQTAHICNQKDAYFFTIALSPKVIDTSKYEAFLKTFTCK